VSSGIHCDNPTCEAWERYDAADKKGFMTVFGGVYTIQPEFVAHFCSWPCIRQYSLLMAEPSEKLGF